ncbi:MAG TPA: pyruvate dehydrogenase (acetyl-transferring), homodimeric type [Candidatus Competibacteraceae bacterium]|nr:pyruvate dehydrogenase (acetyl-transferring), homodimeric type [Candidatus Competibacteraceae bacterium]
MTIESYNDIDPQETREWLEALQGVLEREGEERAHFLLERLIERAREAGADIPFSATTAYINTIPVDKEPHFPGNTTLEHRIRSFVRWNAMAMVVRAGKHTNVGGHIASFASAATLYEIGFNHFWRAPSENHGGDMIFIQGHSAPGIYSRAFLLGRLTEEQLDNYRQEVDGKGLSSYPHPWLMPDFWQFPTVSMGLGPIMGIYQARFMRYMQDRGIARTDGRKVWVFCGDGEMDEPESMGAIGMAGREKLDNLIFVVNCNLQRLDGPVRGNGKIIQELESEFRGAGWNVIKVVWGNKWDALLARDKKGILVKRMMECVDGDYQTFKSKDGAYVREHFFNTPELKELVKDWSDKDIWDLNRGGHDPAKIFAAYKAAVENKGSPTVILAKTIKGYGMGSAGEAMNIAHQAKKMPVDALRRFRDRWDLPVPDAELEQVPYLKLKEGSPELEYMRARRMALGGYLPSRRRKAEPLKVPELAAFDALLKASGEGREISTTMAFVRILNILVKDKNIGRHVVPIVPDESRTFGMEGMFRQLGIWSQEGQKYVPQDADQLMFYKESKDGQILEEGINEAGAMCDWIAAGTAYSTHGVQMIPFYIFYSMFGFQRVGDLAWAAADQRTRGFLLGGTSGRTTLNGEGLQHEDGHSHLWSAAIPNCISYDPTFQYELAVIIQDGLRRMYVEQEDVFYYITVMNENYEHPAMPEGVREDILKGMYAFRKGGDGKGPRVQLLGSGTIFHEVMAAADLLRQDWGVEADLWSCPSFTELAREGNDVARWNLLHPEAEPRVSHVERCLKDTQGPVVAATDYVRLFAEQIRPFVPRRYRVLGTDGFGRSDTREKLRQFFEVNRYYVTVAALKALADEGVIPAARVSEAIKKYGIDPEKPNPMTV